MDTKTSGRLRGRGGASAAARMIAAVAALPLALGAASAQDAFPSRPIQIVNPYPAGGATDILTRVLANGMSARLGAPIVVVNQPGASGGVGTLAASRAAPDGYTLAFVPSLVLSVLPVTQPQSGLRSDALRPVCQAFSNAQAIAVHKDSPLRSLADVAAASRGKPGGLLYGSLGVASIPHLATLQWSRSAGIQLVHVPFRSDGQVMTELFGGRIDMGAIVLASASGQADLRLLAVFDGVRNPAFPDVPTAKEQGFDVSPVSFGGLMAPADTPADRIALLEAACFAAARDDAYRTAARRAFQPEAYLAGAEAFASKLARDIADKREILSGIKLNE